MLDTRKSQDIVNGVRKCALILMLCLGFVCCSDDDDDNSSSSGSGNNTNSNAAMVENGEVSYVSDTSIDPVEVASRMEMPALKGGEDNLFVVHTVSGYDVNYAMEYDCSLKASRWTAYRWYKGFSSNDSGWNRNGWYSGVTWNGVTWTSDPFQEDPLIPEEYRTTLADHTRNGYDRGHMLGSADRLNSMECNGQTFYLSNIHPQLNGFNASGIWYNLEVRLRNQYDTDSFRDTLYVVKGGVIDSNTTYVTGGGNPLICPSHFFMALLCKNSDSTQGGYKAIAFWMEHVANSDTNFADYAISIDELEEKTGIDFFCNLPDDIEKVAEKNLVLTAWGLN